MGRFRVNRRTALIALGGPLLSVSAFSEPMRAIEGEAIVAYLNSVVPDVPPSKRLVVSSTTASIANGRLEMPPSSERLKKGLPEATDAVIADFLRVVADSSALQLPRALAHRDLRLQPVSEVEIDRVFATGGLNLETRWHKFFRAYPEAASLVRLSRVGVDDRSTQALFCISLSSGGMRAQGLYVLMHRRFGIWRVLAIDQAWVA